MSTPSNGLAPKLLYVGDPVVVSSRTTSIVTIRSIQSANTPAKFINMNDLEADNLQYSVQELVMIEKDDEYFWNGEYNGDEFTVFLLSQIYILKLPVKNIRLMLLISNLCLTLVFIFNNNHLIPLFRVAAGEVVTVH